MSQPGGLGALNLALSADTAQFAADLGKASYLTNKAVDEMVSKANAFKNLLGTLGVGLSAGFFVHLIKGSIDSADRLNDLSKTTSIAVEQLAGLKLAAMQSGGDLDSIAQSVNKLAVNMGKDAEKFAALGVSAKDPLEAFKQLADIYVKLHDPQQRAAVMAVALGKAWAGAAPLLSEGGKKIGEMVERGSQLSGATKEMAEQADAFNDKWAELTKTGGLFTRLVGPLLPLLNSLADDMLEAGKNTEGLNSQFKPLAETMKPLIILGANVSFVFQTIGKDIARAAENVKLIAKGDFAGSRALGEMFKKDAEEARKALDEYEKKIMGLGLTGTPLQSAPIDKGEAAAVAKRAAAFLKEQQLAKERTAEYERLARQLVDAEEQSAKEVAEAWKAWEEIQLKNHKDMVDAWALQWKQVFDEIDAEQERAIKEGKEYLDALAQKSKETASWMKDLGFVMTSAFESAIIEGRSLREVLQGIIKDIAKIVIRKQISDPIAGMITGAMGGSGGLSSLVGNIFGSSSSSFTPDYSSFTGAYDIPAFAEGTNYVPRTGLALVHQGEAIIPSAQNRGGGPVFQVDMRGASVDAVVRLERLVMQVNGSIESRAIRAVSDHRMR